MINIIFWLYIFCDIIRLLIFADIILSWLTLLWIKIRPQFLSNIIDPFYNFVRKNIPSTIWMFDFAPFIVLFWFYYIQLILVKIFPEVLNMVQQYSNSINF